MTALGTLLFRHKISAHKHCEFNCKSIFKTEALAWLLQHKPSVLPVSPVSNESTWHAWHISQQPLVSNQHTKAIMSWIRPIQRFLPNCWILVWHTGGALSSGLSHTTSFRAYSIWSLLPFSNIAFCHLGVTIASYFCKKLLDFCDRIIASKKKIWTASMFSKYMYSFNRNKNALKPSFPYR